MLSTRYKIRSIARHTHMTGGNYKLSHNIKDDWLAFVAIQYRGPTAWAALTRLKYYNNKDEKEGKLNDSDNRTGVTVDYAESNQSVSSIWAGHK